MPRGLFLSLDGLDGTGKSTQCRLLADWLRSQGHAVTQCADPGGTPIGDAIRDLLLDKRQQMELTCEAFLFMASRAELVSDVIGSALEAGSIVIADRFLLANVVYQGHAGGLAPEKVWETGFFATGGLEPDLTLVLDLPLEIAQRRRKGDADRVESRADAYHAQVRDGFLLEARRRADRIHVLDASDSVEVVHERIRQEVSHVLATRSRT